MAIFYGALARSGKVRAQTPHVPKTSSEHSTKYSSSKFRSSKVVDSNFQSQQQQSNNTPSSADDHTTTARNETVTATTAVSTTKITFEKYNTMKGWNKLETIQARKDRRIQIDKHEGIENKFRYSTDSNHKKWHRNHPKEGFYQSRQVVDNV